MLRALGVALLGWTATLAAPPEPAWACSCAPLELRRSLDAADAAFVGTAVSRRVEHPQSPLQSSADPAYWTFDVERVAKGELPRRLVVQTAAQGGSCGLELTLGTRTGLLVERRGEGYASTLCWQVDAETLAATAGDRRLWPWALAIGLGVAGLAVLSYRRRRPGST